MAPLVRAQPLRLVSEMQPRGDQPVAIDALTDGVIAGTHFQTLMGATGTGKTFTMANVIARMQRPTLIISHNKTLAAQLYEEMKELFPDNAVCYFVSYYDYYQPEAYIPQRDIYIEKDASRNDDLDRLRLAATTALISRQDVIVVASVSCIFGLGSPQAYSASVISLQRGQRLSRQNLLRGLSDLQYQRSTTDLQRSNYRVRGDVVEIYPASESFAYRIELFGDVIDALQLIHPVSGELLADESALFIFPAVHYVMPEQHKQRAIDSIRAELTARLSALRSEGKLLEAQRLEARTRYDLEMIEEVGYCSGVENYSRHFDGRPPGAMPWTLLDYFAAEQIPDALPGQSAKAEDWLLMIDESHVTLPQLRAMYHGDRQRKQTLVDHGFRLPSALDNRPLTFAEIEKRFPQTLFVSATPGPYELEHCHGEIVEQIIRPTGLLDPVIDIRSASAQVPDLIEEVRKRTAAGERSLITTLTKRLAEDLARFMHEAGIRCRYLHSDIETLDRIQILRELREGLFDVLVGVNLLREGLDLPEVSFVGILDADKAGFLRSATSLIQQIGRAARNENAFVVLYADSVTPAMQQALDETQRRREKQLAWNKEHGLTPRTIRKAIRHGIEIELRARKTAREAMGARDEETFDRESLLADLQKQMLEAADQLAFEKAAALRDRIAQIQATPDLQALQPAGQQEPPPGDPIRRRRGKGRPGRKKNF